MIAIKTVKKFSEQDLPSKPEGLQREKKSQYM